MLAVTHTSASLFPAEVARGEILSPLTRVRDLLHRQADTRNRLAKTEKFGIPYQNNLIGQLNLIAQPGYNNFLSSGLALFSFIYR